jgi:hypothetical protein
MGRRSSRRPSRVCGTARGRTTTAAKLQPRPPSGRPREDPSRPSKEVRQSLPLRPTPLGRSRSRPRSPSSNTEPPLPSLLRLTTFPMAATFLLIVQALPLEVRQHRSNRRNHHPSLNSKPLLSAHPNSRRLLPLPSQLLPLPLLLRLLQLRPSPSRRRVEGSKGCSERRSRRNRSLLLLLPHPLPPPSLPQQPRPSLPPPLNPASVRNPRLRSAPSPPGLRLLSDRHRRRSPRLPERPSRLLPSRTLTVSRKRAGACST